MIRIKPESKDDKPPSKLRETRMEAKADCMCLSHSQHMFITFPSHVHHNPITASSHFHHRFVTFPSCSSHFHCISITCSSHFHHMLIMFPSRVHHCSLMCSSVVTVLQGELLQCCLTAGAVWRIQDVRHWA